MAASAVGVFCVNEPAGAFKLGVETGYGAKGLVLVSLVQIRCNNRRCQSAPHLPDRLRIAMPVSSARFHLRSLPSVLISNLVRF